MSQNRKEKKSSEEIHLNKKGDKSIEQEKISNRRYRGGYSIGPRFRGHMRSGSVNQKPSRRAETKKIVEKTM